MSSTNTKKDKRSRRRTDRAMTTQARNTDTEMKTEGTSTREEEVEPSYARRFIKATSSKSENSVAVPTISRMQRFERGAVRLESLETPRVSHDPATDDAILTSSNVESVSSNVTTASNKKRRVTKESPATASENMSLLATKRETWGTLREMMELRQQRDAQNLMVEWNKNDVKSTSQIMEELEDLFTADIARLVKALDQVYTIMRMESNRQSTFIKTLEERVAMNSAASKVLRKTPEVTDLAETFEDMNRFLRRQLEDARVEESNMREEVRELKKLMRRCNVIARYFSRTEDATLSRSGTKDEGDDEAASQKDGGSVCVRRKDGRQGG